MSPRSILVATFAAAAALATPLSAGFHDHVGLQLYSLRDLMAKEPLQALDLVKSWGLTEVEAAGTANLSAEKFRAELDARGLKCISAHVQFPAMEKDLAGVIAQVKTLGATYAICPWVPHPGEFDAATVARAAKSFNEWGAAFRAAGIQFGYHPHGYEFIPGDQPGMTRFDELVAATDPKNVCFQLDIYWAYVATADPVALLEKYGSRWFSLHLKDVRPGLERKPGLAHTEPEDKVSLGQGEIDWKKLISAAEKAGVKYYIIEDETPAPVENIPASAKFMHGLKL